MFLSACMKKPLPQKLTDYASGFPLLMTAATNLPQSQNEVSKANGSRIAPSALGLCWDYKIDVFISVHKKTATTKVITDYSSDFLLLMTAATNLPQSQNEVSKANGSQIAPSALGLELLAGIEPATSSLPRTCSAY